MRLDPDQAALEPLWFMTKNIKTLHLLTTLQEHVFELTQVTTFDFMSPPHFAQDLTH